MSVNGAWLGAKTAFWLTLIYGWLILLVHFQVSAVGIGVFLVVVLISLFVSGLGALIGWLTQQDLQRSKNPSDFEAILVGMFISVSVLIVIHLLFTGLHTFDYYVTEQNTYPLLLGCLNIIIIFASGWISVPINKQLRALSRVSASNGFAAFTLNQPAQIKDYIDSRRDINSRYEIDLALIRRGHDAQLIESIWQTLALPIHHRRKITWQALIRPLLRWQAGLLVVGGLVALFQRPVGFIMLATTGLYILVIGVGTHRLALSLFCISSFLMVLRLYFIR